MDPLRKSELNAKIPPDLFDATDPIGSGVRRLGRALMAAAIRIESEMTGGQLTFRHDKERQTAHVLLSRINDLLPLLEKYPAPPDPQLRFVPPCPVCGAEAGQHWAHDCPQLDRSGRDEGTYDYRKNEVLLYSQIKPPDAPPPEVFICAVCRGQWKGRFRDELVERGHDFGEQARREQFDAYEKESSEQVHRGDAEVAEKTKELP